MGVYTVNELLRRNIEVRLGTRLTSAQEHRIVLSDGDEFEADTLVWTAGVKPNPLVAETDFPLDEKGRIKGTVFLRIDGIDDAWTAGDSAAIPDLTHPGQLTGPSAQHAVRQAHRLGDNIVAVLRGGEPTEYRHEYLGSVASLGLHKGVAQLKLAGVSIKLRGWPAWFAHRTYHLSRVPTFNRKVRVAADWTLALFFHREIVSLGALQNPRVEFGRIDGAGFESRRQCAPRRLDGLSGQGFDQTPAHAAAPWAASCAAWCSVVSASTSSPSASPAITCGNL